MRAAERYRVPGQTNIRLFVLVAKTGAAASCLVMASCASPSPAFTSTHSAVEMQTTHRLSPMKAACSEFHTLRALERGQQPASPPRPLDAENARELFKRSEGFGFSGGLGLSVGGRILISEGYGLADRARGIPMGPDTIFDIGSVSKQFTAAAILRLEEMGQLGVHDSIARHLPEVPPDKQAITIHHLLTHSAGLPHDVGDNRTNPTRDEAVREMLAADLEFAPGAQYAYSNAGYALLAAIVDHVSGASYERFLRDELWTPLGMTRTGMILGGLDRARVAEGYMFDGPIPPNRYRTPDRDGSSWLVRGAGYILSTLQDLQSWGQALQTGAILSDASRRKLFRPYIRETGDGSSYYAYGWALFPSENGSCLIAHNGSAGAHFANLGFLPDLEAIIAAFSTQQRAPWRNFPDRVYEALAGEAPRLPAMAAQSPGDVKQLAGDYLLPDGAMLPVRYQSGRLHIPMINAAAARLFSPWPILGAERTAALGDRETLVSSVIGGIAERDYEPLFRRLREGVDRQDERAFWEDSWPQWTGQLGAYVDTEMVGTVELGETDAIVAAAEDRLRTLALVRFASGMVLLGFVHDPAGTIFVDWMPQFMMRDIFLAPREDGSFLAYSPVTGRTVSVHFEIAPTGRALRIDTGDETVHAIAANLAKQETP